eukprot:gene7449-13212_t
MRQRKRVCDSPPAQYHGVCFGNDTEKEFCNNQSCYDLASENCTKAINASGQTTCCMLNMTMHNGYYFSECLLNATEFQCPLDRYGLNFGKCEPINGNFTEWGAWSNCSDRCFTGSRHRIRNCTNPLPKYFGVCIGENNGTELCNEHPCYDRRNCTNATLNNEVHCCAFGVPVYTDIGNEAVYKYQCDLKGGNWTCPLDRGNRKQGICREFQLLKYSVPINKTLGEWFKSGKCQKKGTCKVQEQKYERECIDGLYGGTKCTVADVEEYRNCTMDYCPPDTYWSNWSLPSACSKTCGIGLEEYRRSCFNEKNMQVADSECPGEAVKYENCSRRPCPGFILGRPGQNCTAACREKGLVCYWYNNNDDDHRDYRKHFATVGITCQTTTTPLQPWKYSWHPAYSNEKKLCLGFTDVGSSVCESHENLNSTINRLCHCIFAEDLVYSEWSAWSTCSKACGSAYKERQRRCVITNTSKCNENALTQNTTCNLPTCPDDLGFTSWTPWSPCSSECNFGFTRRSRTCNDQALCFGHSLESKMCNTVPCKVHGGWTDWGTFSACSKSCGNGTTTRYRSCTNPAPSHGGNDCNWTIAGDNETRPCNTFHCSGVYLSSPGIQCNDTCRWKQLTCYPFFETNNRTDIFTARGLECNDINNAVWKRDYDPSYVKTGQKCQGFKQVPSQLTCEDIKDIPSGVSRMCNCQNESDIGYSAWSNWGECTATCGVGTKSRYRTCKKQCLGQNIDTTSCFTKHCPVHGMWGEWGRWSLCNRPCNNGTEEKIRFCDNPKPQYNGTYCIGERKRERACNSHPCKPVSLGVMIKFTNETFTEDLRNKSTPAYGQLQRKIADNVNKLYPENENHVLDVEVHFFRPGSVIANFTINYTEITRLELVTLLTSLQENRILTTMPLSEFQIKTDQIPKPPGTVNCTAISESVIFIELSDFSETITSFSITGYSITYRKTRETSESAWKSLVVTNTTTQANLTRLEPFTLYTIRVTAVTIDALGIPSSLTDVSTMEGAPSSPPNNIQCKVTSAKSIYCEWTAVPYASQNGLVTHYTVLYRVYNKPGNLIESGKAWTTLKIPSTTTYADIKDLKPYTRYELKISAATKAGEGPFQWKTLQTDEDVPSSAPLKVRGEGRISEAYVDFFWEDLPADSWNGKPLSLKLMYSVTRKGSQAVLGGAKTVVRLGSDRRRYRVTGLEANWEVTMTIQGVTSAGDGVKSPDTVAETCLCNKHLYATWYVKNPYVFVQAESVAGILPEFFPAMISTICGTCAAYSKSIVHFDRTRNGQTSKRTSEKDLKERISDNANFHGPVSGKKYVTVFEGEYQYVNLIDGTVSAFVVVDPAKMSKSSKITASILQCWPILVVTFLMTVLAGILIWMADQFANPEEMPTGRFLYGTFQGFWWAFVSMTTVGYGDISPRGEIARSIAITWTVVGLVVNGILVSSLSTALTVISVSEQTLLYGANVSAVHKSPEYYLGARRNANMNSTGKLYNTSMQALNALIRREVQGALLEFNEAANLESTISSNGLKISKTFQSTSGIGFVLSGAIASFHTQIRSYVAVNYNLIQSLVKNFTKEVEIPVVTKSNGGVSGLFDEDSTEFRVLLQQLLVTFAIVMILGMAWNYLIRLYFLRRNRVFPKKTANEILKESYDQKSGEMLKIVDNFMSNFETVEKLSEKQGIDRFRLLHKHFGTLPFGLPMWIKYGTTDDRYILGRIKVEEAFLENLNRKKNKRKKNSLKLVDVMAEDTSA